MPEPPIPAEEPDRRAHGDWTAAHYTSRAAMDEREVVQLPWVERRLMDEFGPSLGPEAVVRCISDAVARVDEAPLRNYVMLLVERQATEELRHLARQAAAGVAGGQGRCL